jgi:hypothetical protein
MLVAAQHAHVDFLLGAAAEAAELALLQHAQQLDLRRRRHLGDLVEEQRAAIGQLEAAGAPIVAPVKAPFSWPKISLSSSVSGIAAQLSATNGDARAGSAGESSARRAPCRCPDSPRISIDAGVGAACSST